jgi:hypothetical protein
MLDAPPGRLYESLRSPAVQEPIAYCRGAEFSLSYAQVAPDIVLRIIQHDAISAISFVGPCVPTRQLEVIDRNSLLHQ